jgi:S-adenosylmethionine decarboxylase
MAQSSPRAAQGPRATGETMDLTRQPEPLDPRFFEGAEKKVEIVIDGGQPSLRAAGDDYWGRIVSTAGAQILSKIGNEHCDAYLLSESSLFVFDHKIIMITCGQTRLVDAVIELLGRVPADSVEFFTYERKNEVYPHRQPTSFYDDVQRLDAVLPGKAFRFGDEDEHHILLFHLDRPYRCPHTDLTLEMLMYGIDETVRASFAPGARHVAGDVRGRLGLEDLVPGFHVDDYSFLPSGYSLNGIREDMYWTLHVTPEANGSYVGFETNLRSGDDLAPVIDRLLDLFAPRSFDLFLFQHGEDVPLALDRYRLRSHVAGKLGCGYQVRFRSYHRPCSRLRLPAEISLG